MSTPAEKNPKENPKRLRDDLVPGNPGNSGGKPGRSGRKSNAFKAFCADVLESETSQDAMRAAAASPGAPGFAGVIKLLAAYAYGSPEKVVRHTGTVGLAHRLGSLSLDELRELRADPERLKAFMAESEGE